MTATHWIELDAPEKAGELTGPELVALRDANDLISRQSEAVSLQSRLLEVAAWRKNALMSDIATRHGLDVDSAQYSLDDETGGIFRTAVVVVPPRALDLDADNHREPGL